jgi:hypothetical protein
MIIVVHVSQFRFNEFHDLAIDIKIDRVQVTDRFLMTETNLFHDTVTENIKYRLSVIRVVIMDILLEIAPTVQYQHALNAKSQVMLPDIVQ